MATPVKGMSTRAAQAERTRQQILETAQRLFTELGYDATSLQMIADETGADQGRRLLPLPRQERNPARDHAARNPAARGAPGRSGRDPRATGPDRPPGRPASSTSSSEHRHYAVMASTDPAAKRNKLDGEKVTLAQRALTLLFGDNPTGAERLAFGMLFFIPECLPDLADLTDDRTARSPAADDTCACCGSRPDHRGREASSISMPMMRATCWRSASQVQAKSRHTPATAAIMQSTNPRGVMPACRHRR